MGGCECGAGVSMFVRIVLHKEALHTLQARQHIHTWGAYRPPVYKYKYVQWFICLCTVYRWWTYTTDNESCPGPIPTNPGSIEGSEHGRLFRHQASPFGRGCMDLCGFGVGFGRRQYFVIIFFVCVFYIGCTRPGASMKPPCLTYVFTTVLQSTVVVQ